MYIYIYTYREIKRKRERDREKRERIYEKNYDSLMYFTICRQMSYVIRNILI